MGMSTRIGCSDFVYAPLTSDAINEIVYGAVVKCPGVMSININPNTTQETLFADDGPAESATTLGNISVEVQKAFFTTEQRAALLGHKIDGNGAIVYGSNDTPPWVAIGFRTLKTNGTYRYVWMLKGKFQEPEDNNETKGDSVNFQSDTMTGQFVHTEKAFSIGGKTMHPWKYELDEEYVDANEAAINGWFSQVQLPSNSPVVATTVYLTYGSAGVAGDTEITGLISGKKYTITFDGASHFVTTAGLVGDSVETGTAAALTGTAITGLVNGKLYTVTALD